MIAGSYKSEKPNNLTGNDELQLKGDCINGSIINCIRQPILYSFALGSPPGHKIYKEPRVKIFKKVNKPVLSQIPFYLEDDDNKLVDFNGETISCTCQLSKKNKSMSLKMIRPKNKTEVLILSITKNCETLIKRFHTKPQETLEFIMTIQRETFHFNPPIEVREDWVIGLTDLEVYKSIFNITEENINSNFTNFSMKKVVVFHVKKSEMRLTKTWIFRISQLPIYKIKK